jgi:hypothetical protein
METGLAQAVEQRLGNAPLIKIKDDSMGVSHNITASLFLFSQRPEKFALIVFTRPRTRKSHTPTPCPGQMRQ